MFVVNQNKENSICSTQQAITQWLQKVQITSRIKHHVLQHLLRRCQGDRRLGGVGAMQQLSDVAPHDVPTAIFRPRNYTSTIVAHSRYPCILTIKSRKHLPTVDVVLIFCPSHCTRYNTRDFCIIQNILTINSRKCNTHELHSTFIRLSHEHNVDFSTSVCASA